MQPLVHLDSQLQVPVLSVVLVKSLPLHLLQVDLEVLVIQVLLQAALGRPRVVLVLLLASLLPRFHLVLLLPLQELRPALVALVPLLLLLLVDLVKLQRVVLVVASLVLLNLRLLQHHSLVIQLVLQLVLPQVLVVSAVDKLEVLLEVCLVKNLLLVD